MIDEGIINEDLAPSYFIEGMIYNVPPGSFGTSYENTFVSAINWLRSADRSKFLCANEQYLLLFANSPVTWREESCSAFLNALVKYWRDW